MSKIPAAQRAAEPVGTLGLVAGARAPFEVGTYELDGSGRLHRRTGGLPIRFCFDYRGFRFDAVIDPTRNSLVQLSAACGFLPFTAEDAQARHHLRAIAGASRTLEGSRLLISPSQRISLMTEAVPPRPRTPVAIMATVVSMLLRNRPTLELLAGLLAPRHGAALS